MDDYIAKNMMNCKQIFIEKKKEKHLMRHANMIILTILLFFPSQTLLPSSHFAAMQTFYRPSSIIKKQMY